MKLIKIHNVETGEIVERDINAEEQKQLEIDKIEAEVKAQAEAQAAAAKGALLAKLGITEEETKLLLS